MILRSHFYLKEHFEKDEEKSNVIEYINKHLIPKSKNGLLIGILEDDAQPGIFDISLNLVSHSITNINIIGNSAVVCEYRVLNTHCGKVAKAFVSNGIQLHIKPRIHRYPSGEIIKITLDLAMGDKGNFREDQIDSLLENKLAIREHKIDSLLGN